MAAHIDSTKATGERQHIDNVDISGHHNEKVQPHEGDIEVASHDHQTDNLGEDDFHFSWIQVAVFIVSTSLIDFFSPSSLTYLVTYACLRGGCLLDLRTFGYSCADQQ